MSFERGQFRMSITSSCNMKCVYCHNEGNSCASMLSLDNIKKILDASKDIGLKEIRLTGGDPLVHPQIYEICRMIKEDYHLIVTINTNCILIERLLELIKSGFVSRVVVGLDYFDRKKKKNSPIGLSSKEILSNILKVKNTNCDVSISTVYTNNDEELEKIVAWGIENRIRIKIIEVEKNEIAHTSSKDYLNMQNSIMKKFNFKEVIDDNDEVNGYLGDFRAVSFFHSLCRLRRCDICKNIQLRISSNGIMKTCLYYNNQDENILEGNINEKIKKIINRKVDYHYDKDLIVDEEE